MRTGDGAAVGAGVVGMALGAGVGDVEGLPVGAVVGALEGDGVGAGEGAHDGAGVGDADGGTVGEAVGKAVGEGEGAEDGADVGANEGEGVGDDDGVDDGRLDGMFDGMFDGVDDGRGVGAGERGLDGASVAGDSVGMAKDGAGVGWLQESPRCDVALVSQWNCTWKSLQPSESTLSLFRQMMPESEHGCLSVCPATFHATLSAVRQCTPVGAAPPSQICSCASSPL